MWFVALILVAAVAGGFGYALSVRQQPAVRATAEADAVVAFLLTVQRKVNLHPPTG
jgi:hypothetical protein